MIEHIEAPPRSSQYEGDPTTSVPERVDTVVVGGGIAGCSTAYHLAAAGTEVVLLDRFDLNTQASGRNAGSLHGQIQYGPFIDRGDEWATEFLPALRFLADSLAMWRDLSEQLGTDLEVVTKGGLLVAETDEQLRAIERKVEIEKAAGFPSEVLGRRDLQRMAPYVSPSMAGAGFSALEGKANPLLAAPALARAATRLGAAVFTNTGVATVEGTELGFKVATSRGTIACRYIVIAAGSGIRQFDTLLGAPLPIYDEPIQLSVTEPVAHFVDHLVYFAGGALTFKQAKAGSILIGGGWPASVDSSTGSIAVNPESLRSNLAIAQKVVPRIGNAQVLRAWTGVARNTPDLLPIIGKMGRSGAIVGMYPHMGFTAGPLLGRTLAEVVLGQSTRDLSPFAPDRF